jgi:thiamine biosynthesis lipoprotein
MMGTTFTIIVHDKMPAEKAIDSAYAELERINKIFSTYDPHSEVSKLNANKKTRKASKELRDLILFSEKLTKDSHGAFDIKIGGAVDIWKSAIESQTPPDSIMLQKNISKKRWVKVKKTRIKMSKDTNLDFGAIAKGFAVDRAFEVLKQMGFDTVLIDGGGDIRMGAAPFGSKGWKISQFYEGGKIKFMSHCSIASSGPDYQSIQNSNGVVNSHIVDPMSLKGLSGRFGTTIISESCQVADALATAASILENIDTLAESYSFKANIKKEGKWIVKQF